MIVCLAFLDSRTYLGYNALVQVGQGSALLSADDTPWHQGTHRTDAIYGVRTLLADDTPWHQGIHRRDAIYGVPTVMVTETQPFA